MNVRTLLLLIPALLTLELPLTAQSYRLVDLGEGQALAINNHGHIVGVADDRAVLFDPNGNAPAVDLGTLGGSRSAALAINDRKEIVGWADKPSGVQQAALFDGTGGGANKAFDTAGELKAQALAVNSTGHVVGWAARPTGTSQAALFGTIRPLVYLGALGVRTSSKASAVNSLGQIVGVAWGPGKRERAVLFDPTGNGNNISLGRGQALDINDAGQIVGGDREKALLFEPNTPAPVKCLGTLGGDDSLAMAINSHGQIVGWAENQDGMRQAGLFDATGDGRNVDLTAAMDPNGLVGSLQDYALTAAVDINDNGWIVGWMTHRHAKPPRSFLLVPHGSAQAAPPTSSLAVARRRSLRRDSH